MKYLNRMMFREIKKNWTQFISVFFMTMISVALLSGIAVVWNGLDISYRNFESESNLADVWIYTKGVTDDIVSKLKKEIGDKYMTLSSSIDVSPDNQNSNIKINVIDNFNAFKPVLIEGESLKNFNKNDGIWLDENFANDNNINVGNYIKIGGKYIKVLGKVLNAEYVTYTGSSTTVIPNHKKYGYAFANKNTIKSMYPKLVFSEIRIKGSNIQVDKLKEIIGKSFIISQKREDMGFIDRIDKEISQMKKMSLIFSTIFILLSGLTMFTSMNRLINKQRIIIGTLKAVGIKKSRIELHYIFYGIIVSLIGSIIGYFIGPKIIPNILLKVKKTTISIPKWDLINSSLVYVVLILVVIICAISSKYTTFKILKHQPSDIIRNNISTKNVKNVFMERIPFIWNSLSNSMIWTLRDISRNKSRFLMGVIGVIGGLVLFVSGLGVAKSIENSNEYIYNDYLKYQYISEIKFDSSLKNLKGEKQFEYQNMAKLEHNDIMKKCIFTAAEDNGLIEYIDNNTGKKVRLSDDTVLITRKLAKQLKVNEGDNISLEILGKNKKDIKISHILSNLSPQGVIVNQNYFEKNFGIFIPNTLLVRGGDYSEIKDNIFVKNVVSKEEQKKDNEELLNSVNSIMKILVISSVFLFITIMSTLGTLNFIERERDYATLRVLGFYRKEVKRMMRKDLALTVLLGIVLGTFLSIKFLAMYVSIIAFDSVEWIPFLDIKTIAVSIFATIIISISVTKFLESKVGKIDLVSTFKSVE